MVSRCLISIVADLVVGVEELELHYRCRCRCTFRKIRIARVAVRMVLLKKKYRNTPPICIAMRLQLALQCFRCPYAQRKEKYSQYSSHLYRSTPPICIAMLGKVPWTLDPHTFEYYRDTAPISIAMLLQKYALLLAESSIYTTKFVSRYGSDLYRDAFFGSIRVRGRWNTPKIQRKKTHAHKNKIGTSTHPSKNPKTPPPTRRNFMGMGGFQQKKATKCQAPIKLVQPFPGPRIAGGKITDMRPSLATRAAIYRSLQALRARNRKNVSKRVLGAFFLLGIFSLFSGIFETFFSRPPKRPFLRLFCDFGPGGSGDFCKWRLGSQAFSEKCTSQGSTPSPWSRGLRDQIRKWAPHTQKTLYF